MWFSQNHERYFPFVCNVDRYCVVTVVINWKIPTERLNDHTLNCVQLCTTVQRSLDVDNVRARARERTYACASALWLSVHARARARSHTHYSLAVPKFCCTFESRFTDTVCVRYYVCMISTLIPTINHLSIDRSELQSSHLVKATPVVIYRL